MKNFLYFLDIQSFCESKAFKCYFKILINIQKIYPCKEDKNDFKISKNKNSLTGGFEPPTFRLTAERSAD